MWPFKKEEPKSEITIFENGLMYNPEKVVFRDARSDTQPKEVKPGDKVVDENGKVWIARMFATEGDYLTVEEPNKHCPCSNCIRYINLGNEWEKYESKHSRSNKRKK